MDDQRIAVEVLRHVVARVPEYQIAWVAHDGAEAVDRCRVDLPDLILMDLVMPVMNGVEATKKIMQETPCPILLVTATVDGNCGLAFDAMGYGAMDAVDTPALGLDGKGPGAARLLTKIETIFKLVAQSKPQLGGYSGRANHLKRAVRPPLIAFGASTGGPKALAKALADFPLDYPAPILVVQHIDPSFAVGLASWLDDQVALRVRLAVEGDEPEVGVVLLAASNDHMVLKSDLTLAYSREPVENSYRPSVDVLFESLRAWPVRSVATLLTGMGQDGALGLLGLKQLGWHTLVQNEETSAVFGMPRVAIKLGAATEVLPVESIGAAIMGYLRLETGNRQTVRRVVDAA